MTSDLCFIKVDNQVHCIKPFGKLVTFLLYNNKLSISLVVYTHIFTINYVIVILYIVVTTAEASTSSSSTTESSTAQSTAALLQSSIASAAATGSVLPNLQYMISGSAQGVCHVLCVCMCIHVCLCVCMYVRVCVCVCLCLSVCMRT